MPRLLRRYETHLIEQFNEDEPSPKEMQRGEAFTKGFLEMLSLNTGEVDLSRWPEMVPYLPDSEDLETIRKEEEALVRLCRSEIV